MPPAVYQHVLASCQAALRDLFVCVATPIEGPGKKDFGDIDILVALDRRAVFPTSRNDSVPRTPHELMGIAQRLLGAKYVINRGSSANLAIPWPAGMGQHSVVPPGGCGPGEATAGDGVMKEKYIQVDVTICQDVGQLHWVGITKSTHTHQPASNPTDGDRRISTSTHTATFGTFSGAPSGPSASRLTRRPFGSGYPKSRSLTARRPRSASVGTRLKSCISSG